MIHALNMRLKVLVNTTIPAVSILCCLAVFGDGKRPLAKSIVMATLNGKPITLLDVLADTAPQEKKLAMRYSGERLKKEKWKLRREAIKNIIDRRLVYAQFKKRKYRLPDSIIERMLDGLAKSLANGDRKLLEKKARAAGLTMADLREQAKERAAASLLINERCSKSVYITPKQIHDYYLEHKKEFTIPSKLRLQAIFLRCSVKDSAVAKFAERLRKTVRDANEKRFANYASIYSEGPNHKNGGRIGWIPESDLRPEFSKPLSDAESGSIHGPINTPEGIYIIRVAERTEPVSKSFDEVKADIREKLTDAERKRKYNAYAKRLRECAVIRYFDDAPKALERQNPTCPVVDK